MKKGYVLTLDAIVALVLVTVVFVTVLGIHDSIRNTEEVSFKKIHYTSEDAVEVLNKKGVLDQVCTDWAMADNNKTSPNWIAAESTAKQHLSQIIPERMGYRLMIDGQELCNDSRVPEGGAKVKTHSTRMLTGYLPGLPTQAYVARASLNETNVSYGAPLKTRQGCNWTVEFFDNTNTAILLPGDYSGAEGCSYMGSGTYHNNDSAVGDAIYRLFTQLDTSPPDGRLDKKFNPGDVMIGTSVVGGVRSLWGPVEVKLVVWMG